MDKKFAINDEELEMVSGGIAETGDDSQAAGRCPYCTTLMNRTASGYVCPDCGSMFDLKGTQIGGMVHESKTRRTGGSSFGSS